MNEASGAKQAERVVRAQEAARLWRRWSWVKPGGRTGTSGFQNQRELRGSSLAPPAAWGGGGGLSKVPGPSECAFSSAKWGQWCRGVTLHGSRFTGQTRRRWLCRMQGAHSILGRLGWTLDHPRPSGPAPVSPALCCLLWLAVPSNSYPPRGCVFCSRGILLSLSFSEVR